MENSRTKNVALNTITRTLASVVLILLNFWSRRIFFNTLGQDLLGINSLFQDVLNILDFTDLGFSTVLMVSMYEPIANKNYEKIHSLLDLSKKVYRFVMLAIATFGLLTIPILKFVNTDVPFGRMILYYIPFLINNILSYLWAYKETYLDACQKHYKFFFIDIIQSVSSVIIRTLILIYTGSFMAYIFCMIAVTIIKKLCYSYIVDKECPEIKYTEAKPLDEETKKSIINKSKAMMVQKFSSLGITQTDSFIVSVILNSSTWAVVSNYNLIKSSINTLLNGLINALIPSMGHLINSESVEKQMSVFYQYDFINNWIYILVFAEAMPLINVVIMLIFNDQMVMRTYQIFVFFFSFYLQGLIAPINVMRESSGMFEKDQWVSIVACLTNLVTSIIFINLFGLVGVFYGTILSSVIFIVCRVIIYFSNYADKKYIVPYFITIGKNILSCLLTVICTYCLYQFVLQRIFFGIVGLVIDAIILFLVYLAIFLVLNFKNENLKLLIDRVKRLLFKIA